MMIALNCARTSLSFQSVAISTSISAFRIRRGEDVGSRVSFQREKCKNSADYHDYSKDDCDHHLDKQFFIHISSLQPIFPVDKIN